MKISIKKFIIASAVMISAPVLLVTLIIGAGYIADFSAQRKAAEFCKEISIGSDVSAAVSSADVAKIFHYNEGNTVIFQFPALLLSTFDCTAETKDLKVTTVSVQKDMW